MLKPCYRLCPKCGSSQHILQGESVWPSDWKCLDCTWSIAPSDGISLLRSGLPDAVAGYDPAFFQSLADLQEGNYWFAPRSRLLTGLAQRWFPQTSRYLEIGCGTGFVLRSFENAFTRAEIYGSELYRDGLALAYANESARIRFVQMDATQIPARAAFDLIGIFDVLEHIEDDEKVLHQINSSLRPGGGLIASVPQHPRLWSETDRAAHHVRRYKRGELEAKMKRAGLEPVLSTSYVATLLPLMVLIRFVRKDRALGRDAVLGELSAAPFVNRLLRSALNLEVSATLNGFRWFCGGSRIVVARKEEKNK